MLIGFILLVLIVSKKAETFFDAGEYIGKNRIILVNSQDSGVFEKQLSIQSENPLTFSKGKIIILRIDQSHELIKDHPGKKVFLMDFDGRVKFSDASLFTGEKIARALVELEERENENFSE